MTPMTLRRIALALVVSLAAGGCVESARGRRYSRAQAQASLGKLESPGLLIGEFALAPDPVLDGDTIRVDGLDTTLRLLALDAEESIKDKFSGREMASDFERYLRDKRGDSDRPVKAATPLGEEAKRFAGAFFEGVERVRLERDHPKEIRDRYDRYLAYAFVARGGTWVNYNVECVRAGMSPYFTKYGYSRRFHREFVAAEAEARAARRGIWAPGALAYRDYAERKAWWDGRADFLLRAEREADGKDDHVILTQWDSLSRLEARMGQEVTVVGQVSQVHLGERGPSRAMLSRRMFSDLALVFFDKDVFHASRIAESGGELVQVTGVVNEYQNKHTKKRTLQLLVNLPSQVVRAPLPTRPAPRTAGAQP